VTTTTKHEEMKNTKTHEEVFYGAFFMMTVEQATDLIRDAMLMTLIIIGPILAIGMVVGLVISLVQAVTQIQEQTLAFVPKIFAMAAAIVILMPWMFQRLLDYTHQLFTMTN